MLIKRSWMVIIVFFALSCNTVETPELHADYVVLGKSINHRQNTDGELVFLNTVFFGEIFRTENGTVTNGYLAGPGEASDNLMFSDGDVLFLAGKRQFSIEALTENFPDTTYYFNFDTPDGSIRNMPVTFTRDKGQIRNPGPIRIFLHQDGKTADPGAIDPDIDLVVSWSKFDKGAADPKGLIDDMIYVIMGDCWGEKIVHSGPAFNDGPNLTFRETEFIIPKEKLDPGLPYQVEVEHSEMDTGEYENIEIIVTYAASSFLDIKTTGINTKYPDSPAVPYAMDGGQTDRVKKNN
ncbi:MAG: hypothetical protein GY863_06645 [bacterium]|nr:hypothetical protein [bacterium]